MWAQVDGLQSMASEDAVTLERAKVPSIVAAAEYASLREFCEDLGIPWEDPKFRLAVYWDGP